MFTSISNIQFTRIIRKTLSKPFTFKRIDHGLIIRLSEKERYDIDGERFVALRGEAVFIPKGYEYTTSPMGDSKNEYINISFNADGCPDHLMRFKVDDLQSVIMLHADMMRRSVFDVEKSRLAVLSSFYKILSMLSPIEERGYLGQRKQSLIRPAIEYLEENIFSPELKLNDLHTMCGISAVYFRRLFALHTGVAPKEYVSTKRLERARSIIWDSPRTAIKDVAAAVGYTDPLYFSRIYKKRYSLSPSNDFPPKTD